MAVVGDQQLLHVFQEVFVKPLKAFLYLIFIEENDIELPTDKEGLQVTELHISHEVVHQNIVQSSHVVQSVLPLVASSYVLSSMNGME